MPPISQLVKVLQRSSSLLNVLPFLNPSPIKAFKRIVTAPISDGALMTPCCKENFALVSCVNPLDWNLNKMHSELNTRWDCRNGVSASCSKILVSWMRCLNAQLKTDSYSSAWAHKCWEQNATIS